MPSLFDSSPVPRVFGVAPGADFPKALVAGLRSRLSDAPADAVARVTVVVNTSRMRRRLTTLLQNDLPGFLPRILLLTEIAESPSVLGQLPGVVPPLRRKLELAQLVGELLKAAPDLAAETAAFDLAESLAELLGELHDEGVAPGAIRDLDVGDLSAHWARSKRFLEIVLPFTQTDAMDTADPALRLRQAVKLLSANWRAHPPTDPILVAGSTGSRGTTALLMDAVAGLPQGAVILPGFDFDQPEPVWQKLDDAFAAEDHPQFRFRHQMTRLGLTSGDIAPWSDIRPPVPARNALVSLALRPAPVTDAWLREGPDLKDVGGAFSGLSLIEAPSSRMEAQAIALALREAAETGTSAALISPDRNLTRQVSAALDCWRIEPDDSAGKPLALSAPGRLLRQVADMMTRPPDAEEFIALLKHPLVATGGTRGTHLRLTRELELWIRRKGIAYPDARLLQDWVSTQSDEAAPGWADWLGNFLTRVSGAETGPLGTLVATHLALSELACSGSESTHLAGELWDKAPGEAARAAMDDLAAQAESGGNYDPTAYVELLDAILNGQEVRDPMSPHPAIMIWGTLEARVQGADLVILSGLNEGVWPALPSPDPWLNRSMRRQIGLTLPDRRIGLQAHDFQQAICAPRVILTRSTRDDEAATVAARWLNRLTSLLEGIGEDGQNALQSARRRGESWLTLARAVEVPETPTPPEPRPAPRPPIPARPTALPVTDIERLRRDPFAIYAKHLLRLRPLNPLRQTPDARLRGTVLHKVMATFVQNTKGREPSEEDLLSATESVLTDEMPWPAAQRLWRARIARIAPPFIAEERARRARATPLAVEIPGEITMGTGFRLYGTADRIDQTRDGSLIIYDYKTGSPPTPEQRKHFNRQLPLEAAMAERGGFREIPPADVSEIAYLGLGSTLKTASDSKATNPDFVAESVAGLLRLLAHFDDPSNGYIARLAPYRDDEEGDYDHLARSGEWDDGDDPMPEDVK